MESPTQQAGSRPSRAVRPLATRTLLAAASASLRIREYPNPAIWAAENRILPSDSAEPGPYRPERTPYFVPIYEAIADQRYKRIIIAMGSQMGKTEFCFNVIGHRLDCSPIPIIFAMPTEYLAQSISKGRFSKMMRGCKSLRDKLGIDQITEKQIAGSSLRFAWTTSATQLCSHPACLILLDERDRMNNDVEGEGDPLDLLEARTTTYLNAKAIVTSTPTLAGASPIWALFEEGIQHKWAIPCPQCGSFLIPSLSALAWDSDNPAELKRAWLHCPCGAEIEDSQRHALNAKGKFLAVAQTAQCAASASFWVSGLCSPWRSYLDAARKWLEAKASDEHSRMQSVINTVFGECYALRGEAQKWEFLWENLRGEYADGEVPQGVEIITCGVDIQQDCIYYAIRGWAKEEQSYLISHGIIYGSTEDENTWRGLEAILHSRPVRLACIDAGYRSHFVYAFCKEVPGCLPCKGTDRAGAPIRATQIEMDFRGKRFSGGIKLFHVDDFHFKSLLFSHLRMKKWYLPRDIDEEYCRQICAEELVTNRAGKPEWNLVYRNNHYLDCEKLNLVAANILRVDLLGQAQTKPRQASKGIDIYS